MDSNENPISVPPEEDLPDLTEVKKPTSLLVAQFFLFPLIVIAFGVGIFVLFGYMAYEEDPPRPTWARSETAAVHRSSIAECGRPRRN